jgi:DNA-binding transcriptional MerR regulator
MSTLHEVRGRSPAVHALISISRLAALTGVTARALRHYEEVGLIRPGRDAHGVRVFDRHECEVASLIVMLRRCDVPLNEVRRVLGAAEGGEREARLRQALRRKEVDLARKLETVRSALSAADTVERPQAA